MGYFALILKISALSASTYTLNLLPRSLGDFCFAPCPFASGRPGRGAEAGRGLWEGGGLQPGTEHTRGSWEWTRGGACSLSSWQGLGGPGAHFPEGPPGQSSGGKVAGKWSLWTVSSSSSSGASRGLFCSKTLTND